MDDFYDLEDIGKPILDYFEKNKYDLCIGIAKSNKQLFISKGYDKETNRRLLTYTKNDNRLNIDISKLESLTTAQKKEFFRAYDSHYFNSYFIPLRTPNGVYDFTKCFDANCSWTNEILNFKGLQDIIENLPFEKLGRTFLIYTPCFGRELTHIDYWPTETNGEFYDGSKHFMWASLDKSLKLNNKSIDKKCFMFNFQLPHTTPSSERSTISIRIEGKFTRNLCESKGIKWKP